MKLLTKALLASIPKYGETENVPLAEKVAHVKIFDPSGRLTFYIYEMDGDDLAFGWMVSPLGPDCDELGTSSIRELEAVRTRFGLRLERDIHWKPGPVPKEDLNRTW